MMGRGAVVAVFAGLFCPVALSQKPIHYIVKLADPERHLVQVTVEIPPGLPTHELQLPVWNALYQVRDFSQYMNWIRAADSSGHTLPLQQLNDSRWRVTGAEHGARIDNEMFSNDSVSLGADIHSHLSFLNYA